ncbi:MAG: HAMP domain-containing sensor histidine kinase [Bacteroidota bacterium]
MRLVSSQSNHSHAFSRAIRGTLPDAGELCSDGSAHSEGVPFQLIFGQQTGQGIYFNTGVKISQLLGIAPEDFTESLYYSMIEEIIPLSGDIPVDMSLCRRKFINGEIKSYAAEVLIRHPGGGRKWILDTSVPLYDNETGMIIGSQGYLYDDNGRKRILDLALEQRRQSDETEKLKAAFLHNISHEIRTPLNAIIGFSTLLDEYSGDPVKRREFLDIISRSSDHLLAIIDDIVEVSRIDAKSVKISRERVDLDLVLWKIYEQFRHIASSRTLTFNYTIFPGGHSPEVFTDRYKVMQILRNLVSNALKFTHEGRVEYGYSLRDGMIEFYVSDTGIGITGDQRPHIFSRFYQGDSSERRSYDGTGLGLSISKAYVELLGGEIWFDSRPGEGSVFRFTIPEERMG